MTTARAEKVTTRMWFTIVLIGLAGQFAWSIENMYLNTYITYLNFSGTDSKGFDYNTMIAITTALSAIVATLTTLFMGALSDKLRRRKIFISLGYLFWGLATASFGLLNVASQKSSVKLGISPKTAAVFVILIDCIMTFFGSTGNDACFNGYVTEHVEEGNRSKVEGVLSILPLLSMLIIFVCLNGLTTDSYGNRWDLFFYIVGGIVFSVGILSFFLLPKEEHREMNQEAYLPSLILGFRPKVIKSNKKLYLVFLIYALFQISQQVFFPYLMVYIEKSCSISNNGDGLLTPFSIVMAIALLVGSLLSLIVGFVADKIGKDRMILPTLYLFFIGTLSMTFIPSFSSDTGRLVYGTISTLVMILGFVSVPTVINALVREYIPKGKEGGYMGVRMVFVVALPMCIGPFIGSSINKAFGKIYTGNYGVQDHLPSSVAYPVAAAILVFCLIPLFFLRKEMRKDEETR